jgi:hypothetical protein
MDIPETNIINANLLKNAQEDILSKEEYVFQIMIIIIALPIVITMESHAFATQDLP